MNIFAVLLVYLLGFICSGFIQFKLQIFFAGLCSEKKIQESRTFNKAGHVFSQVSGMFLKIIDFNEMLCCLLIIKLAVVANLFLAGLVHNFLIKEQLASFCRQHFGCDHPKYADTLIDYGYYLLNVDAINLSVKVYKVSIPLKNC